MNNRKPNIVICLADQLRPFELGCHGHAAVKTPNIDAMAARGVRFDLGCSNSPLCVPARHIVLAGQSARRCMGTNSNYISFPPSDTRDRCLDLMLPEILRGAGYRTGVIGKWHIYPRPDLVGFDEVDIPHNLHRHYGQSFYDRAGNRREITEFSMDYESRRVREFMAAADDRPFFLYYNLSPPHSPLCDAPERYLNMYARDDVCLRPNVFRDGKLPHNPVRMRAYTWDYLGHLPDNLDGHEAEMSLNYEKRISERPLHGLKRVYRDVFRLLDDPVAGPVIRRAMPYLDYRRLDEHDLIDLYRFYYGMTTCIDDYVGRFFEHLDALGLSENTIVLFSSDHGDMLGSHGAWMKSHVYDEAVRIPYIWHWPAGLAPRADTDQIATQLDIMPTLLSLAGVAVPSCAEGQDLAPVLRGECATLEHNRVYIDAYVNRMIGVRTPTHLYAMPVEGAHERQWRPAPDEQHWFFDLRNDPCEMHNLAGTTEQASVMAALRDDLLAWHAGNPCRHF